MTVELYDAFLVLLYGTTTAGDGTFTFMTLSPGTYHVVETDPLYYTSPPLTNDISVTLPPDGVVNFADQVNGNADLEITKICSTLFADGTDQMAFFITVTNNGPGTAVNTALTDDFISLIAAGLSNFHYIIDAGVLTPWPVLNTLPLGDMAPGDSHVIRIFASVAPAFIPEANTAEVASDIFDPGTGDNIASCTNEISAAAPGAIKFENPSCTACSSACLPGDFNVSVPDRNINNSLDLTASGTIEAWIQATSCTNSDVDAGIVMKGTTAGLANACYGFGLAGGTVFDNSPIEGTAQNIGFRVGGTVLVADGYTLSPGKWYHVACTWNGAGMNIYINGILEKPGPASAAITNDEDLMLGQQTIVATPSNGQYFGVIEEFRLWDTARAQGDIQNDMCRTLTLPAANLVCYLQYNEGTGTVAVDASGNGNDGDTTAAFRVCSEAPVGDESAPPDYTGSAFGDFSTSLAAGGETLTVTGDGGAWDDNPAASPPYKSGLQVYRVNDAPETGNAPLNTRLFGDRGYFGVFVTGGDLPTYSVTYTYNDAGIGDEAGLDLMYRHQGCAPWSHLDITLPNRDTGLNTLTRPLMSGTEYILGKNVDPRNAIQYDGTGYVSVPDDTVTNTLDLNDSGTLEAWIYPDVLMADAGIVLKGTSAINNICYGFGLAGGAVFTGGTSAKIGFAVGNTAGGVYSLLGTADLTTGKWYHIACVWENDNTAANIDSMTIYINGAQDATISGAGILDNAATINDEAIRVGMQAITPTYFQGQVDEVRIWNIARNQIAIRNTMCQKLTGSEAGLTGNWRFDDETDSTTCPDYTVNNNDGAMFAFGSNAGDDIRDARVCSSAPIGDDSAYDYYDGVVTNTVSAQLAHSDGDYMFGAQNNGTWTGTFSGIQIYRLDEAPVYPPDMWEDTYYDYQTPNGLTPPEDLPPALPPVYWSSVDYYRYWGVFVTDWLNTPKTYDVTYYYNGNPSVPVDDSKIGLARRPDYCFGTWTDSQATLITGLGGTLTKTLETGTEYVLGGTDAPLAITLASFTATASDGCVDVAWETATEINTAGFHAWRSENPLVGFVRVTDGLIASESVMETMGAKYAFRDCGVDFSSGKKYYYILEEIEMDSTGDSNMHGPIGPVSEIINAAQTTDKSSGSACFIDTLGL